VISLLIGIASPACCGLATASPDSSLGSEQAPQSCCIFHRELLGPDFALTKEIRKYYKLTKIQGMEIMEFFLCVMGMVMIVEGLPYFAAPSKIKVWVTKLVELPDSSLRLMGFLLMFAGLGLVYLGRS
jgi:uncharacterized protein YjeT (DUF2065 family)